MAPSTAPSSSAYSGAVNRARKGRKIVRTATPSATISTGNSQAGSSTPRSDRSVACQPKAPPATTRAMRNNDFMTTPSRVIVVRQVSPGGAWSGRRRPCRRSGANVFSFSAGFDVRNAVATGPVYGRSVHQSQTGRGDGRVGRRKLDDELGAVGGKDELAHQHRLPVRRGGDPTAPQHRCAGRHLQQGGVLGGGGRRPDRLGGA